MRGDDFELLLGLVRRLSVEQRRRLRQALAGGEAAEAVAALVEARLGERPACLICGGARVQRWGRSHGLQRWRCRDCERSFNALTGTPLARLRKKAQWLAFAEALSERLSVKAAAERCGVHPTTSFRWRHRFLRAETAQRDQLAGIVEADETFFRLSFKGSRRWQDDGERPSRPPKRRGTRAQAQGLSIEQVPVLVARDRSGATRAHVLGDRSAAAVEAALAGALPQDAILCSDAWAGYAALAKTHNLRHEPINLSTGPRVRERTWHIQNANAHHSRLKAWIHPFKGVATRYLPNYLAWHHSLERTHAQAHPPTWLNLALNS